MADDLLQRFIAQRAALLGYLRLLLPSDDAVEDVFQDTFLVVSRRAADFEEGRDFAAWVRGIARNLALKRRIAAHRMGAVDPQILANALDRAYDEAEQEGNPLAEDIRHLHTCLQRLDGPQQDLLRLRYEHGHGMSELAATTGRTEHAIQIALSRLRAVLHACISRQRRVHT